MKNKILLMLTLACIAVFLMLGIVNAETASTSASVTNSVPVASSAALPVITLTSNTTTNVRGNITITDNNGCEDITSVTSTLFRTNITGGSGAADNNRTHYSATCVSNSDCTAGGSDLTETYNCTFSMTHYADPTDAGSLYAATNWTFNVTPSDGTTGTSDSTVQELNTLTSLSLDTSSVAFGTLALGADTGSSNTNTTIANHGNEGLDVSLTGFGSSAGDNLSMTCTIGTTAINKLEYNNTGFTYGGGIALTNTTTELDLDIAQGSDSTPRPTKDVRYGFGLPSTGVEGSCTGTLTITAVSDPTTD